ncbi:protocadherin gamma-A1-like [Haliotis cracherodii]|uniref:protocadherin gamma-A1-like n=1 Tax=Haliotis cracherodii TaxID=6455 RepID=UPI0039E90FB3
MTSGVLSCPQFTLHTMRLPPPYGSFIEVTTSKSGSFSLANEKGVTVADRNSILFTVKACSDAVIVLSDIASISDNQGNYFLLMIGKSGNSSQVMDSCFTCPRTKVVPGKFVDCNVAKPFWLHWDGTGLFEFGKGRVIGRETSLTMNGRKGTYMTNFLQITSTGSTPAVFSFEKDRPLTFTSPKQDGSSIVSVNETTPVNSTLLVISESPSSPNITMSVAGEGHEVFYVEGRELRVKKPLDYETITYYALVVTSDVGKSVAVLISVLDVNDETPSLSINRHVDIPEEVSVGTVFGGIYNVSDLDEGDNLTLSLSGNASTLFEATGNGHLKVIKRLDRDGPEGTTYIKNVTLTVTDVIGHTVSAMFDLNVLDINDNSPVCKLDYHNQSIEENNQDDIILMNLTTICDDMDDGENGNLTYTVLGEEWVMSSFTVREGALVARAHGLDRENTSQCDVTTFFVLVKDNAKRVRRKTYIHVNLKVIPVNEFPPRWNSARAGGPDKLDTIHVYSAAPTGSVIANLAATDEDVGDDPLVYSIAAIQTGNESFKMFGISTFK